MEEGLSPNHQRTYQAIFNRPPRTDLRWSAIRSLLSALCTVEKHADGTHRLTRRGRKLALQPDTHVGLASLDDLAMLQRFLEGPSNEQVGGTPGTGSEGACLLVLVDAERGRIYRLLPGEGTPETIEPFDPQGAGRTLHYMREAEGSSPDPGRESFHEAIARAVRGAARIIIAGRGKKAAQPMERLADYLKKYAATEGDRLDGTMMLGESTSPGPPALPELLSAAKRMSEQSGGARKRFVA